MIRWATIPLLLIGLGVPAMAQYNRPYSPADTSWLPANYAVQKIRPGQKLRAAKVDLDSVLVGGSGGTSSYVLTTDGNGKVSWSGALWGASGDTIATPNKVRITGVLKALGGVDVTGTVTATGNLGVGTGATGLYSGWTNKTISLENTSSAVLGYELSHASDALSDGAVLGGVYILAGTGHNLVGQFEWAASGTSENGAQLTLGTSSAGSAAYSRWFPDGDVSLGSTNDSGKDFAVFAGSAWTGFDQGATGLSSSSSPALKWGARPVAADTVQALRAVFADSLPMETWHYRTEVVENQEAVAKVAADSARIVGQVRHRLDQLRQDRTKVEVSIRPRDDGILASWANMVGLGDQAVDTVVVMTPGEVTIADSIAAATRAIAEWQQRVDQVTAATRAEAVRLANVRHTGLMAPVAARISRLIAPDEVDTTTTNGGHLLNAAVVVIGDLVRRQRDQDVRIADLERRLSTMERGH